MPSWVVLKPLGKSLQGFANTVVTIPAESQLLRVSSTRLKGEEHNDKPVTKLIWGVPWTPENFVMQAISKGHPRAFGSLLPDTLQDAVDQNCALSSLELAELRTRWFQKWVTRAKSLSTQESNFKSSLAPHLQHILQPKRLLLLKEIVEAEGYPDPGVFDEVSFGTELTGCVPLTGVFDPAFKPALMTRDELVEQAVASNKAIYRSVRSSGDDEVDTTVFQKTLEERDAGWLRGPIPFHELTHGCVLSRRFGLKQPNKIRLIDDLSKSNINSTVQTPEAPRPHSTDVVASLALAVLLGSSGRKVLGKTFDLKSAYRQLGIHPNSLSCSSRTLFVLIPFQGDQPSFRCLRCPLEARGQYIHSSELSE